MFCKFADNKSVAFNRMVQPGRIPTRGGRIRTRFTPTAAFIGQKQVIRQTFIDLFRENIHRLLERMQSFCHSFKIKGILKVVFPGKQQHRIVLFGSTLTVMERTYSRRTCPCFPVISAGILLANASYLGIIPQLLHIQKSCFPKANGFCKIEKFGCIIKVGVNLNKKVEHI